MRPPPRHRKEEWTDLCRLHTKQIAVCVGARVLYCTPLRKALVCARRILPELIVPALMSDPASKPLFPKKRRRGHEKVETVVAGAGFPVSSKRPRSRARDPKEEEEDTKKNQHAEGSNRDHNKKGKPEKLLDWHETAREIRQLGSTGLAKRQKRKYEDEEYKRLTGRERPKQKVPRPIVRALKKQRAEKEAKAREEAQAAGLVLPQSATAAASQQSKTKEKKGSKDARHYGPAPSIGFVKKGVFQLKKKPV